MNAKQMREKRGALVEQMQGMVAAAKQKTVTYLTRKTKNSTQSLTK